MQLIDITKENWEDVIFLSTNETLTVKGSGEPYEAKGMPSLCEEYVASNALSIVQSVYEDGWVIKAIEHDGELIGFTMFGWSEEEEFYELCRIMIDRRYQNKGYGTQAIRMILQEMKARFGCREVYLSTDPENERGKHVYEKIGFRSEHELLDGEELYKYVFTED
ncbi:MAG: GNAT family N-acetyltransferase [Lachnospiraceae bacterium]|nr:GNAT family N-acetyltransferase [Lachnospiraceae bacterium]